ncbi:MAG: hypothetical protein HUU28_11430 [Planctomycetaceae bacterium]|nr:hypothetical protein [Planctomycetaceae bacterium]
MKPTALKRVVSSVTSSTLRRSFVVSFAQAASPATSVSIQIQRFTASS